MDGGATSSTKAGKPASRRSTVRRGRGGGGVCCCSFHFMQGRRRRMTHKYKVWPEPVAPVVYLLPVVALECYYITELFLQFKSHVGRTFGYTAVFVKTSIKDTTAESARLTAWVGAIRCESTRKTRAEVFSRSKRRRVQQCGGGRRARLVTTGLSYNYGGKRRKKKCHDNTYEDTQPVIRAIGVLAKMSFDKIFDLTAGVYYNFYIRWDEQK